MNFVYSFYFYYFYKFSIERVNLKYFHKQSCTFHVKTLEGFHTLKGTIFKI